MYAATGIINKDARVMIFFNKDFLNVALGLCTVNFEKAIVLIEDKNVFPCFIGKIEKE